MLHGSAITPTQISLFCRYAIVIIVIDGSSSSVIRYPSGSSRSVLRNQILRSFISWKDRTRKLLWMSWRYKFQLQEADTGENLDSQDGPALSRY